MRRLILPAGCVLAVALPAGALANPVSSQHARTYLHAYHAARAKFGARTVGCDLLERRGSCHRRASDRSVVRSIGVLERMLTPPRAVVATTVQSAVIPGNVSSVSVSVSVPVSSAPASGLAACIISRESGGNIRAVNGQHTGEAQWSPSSWAGGGGTRYAATPLQASKAQQDAVLNGMLAHGQAGQWTPYDGC